LNLGVAKSVLKAMFWLNLGASLSFFAFVELPGIEDIYVPMLPLLVVMFFLMPSLLFLELLHSTLFSWYALTAGGIVSPMVVILAYKFRANWARLVIGMVTVFFTLFIFSLSFMDTFEKAVAKDVKRQKIDCIYVMPSFKQLVTRHINSPGGYAYVFALKDGSKYLWSFEAMAFVDIWEENTADMHGGCYGLSKDAPK
jgi:hypothetical protein